MIVFMSWTSATTPSENNLGQTVYIQKQNSKLYHFKTIKKMLS